VTNWFEYNEGLWRRSKQPGYSDLTIELYVAPGLVFIQALRR
jgi:hypothetical protein